MKSERATFEIVVIRNGDGEHRMAEQWSALGTALHQLVGVEEVRLIKRETVNKAPDRFIELNGAHYKVLPPLEGLDLDAPSVGRALALGGDDND